MHHPAGPVAAKVGPDAAGVEVGGNPALGFATLDELAIDISNDFNFLGGARSEDDAVGLQALVLAARQLGFPLAILADQYAAQAKSCRATLAIAQLDQAALARKDLDRQLAAVFARHRSFHTLDDGGDGAAVLLELLGAILDLNVGATADVFVIGGFIGILKPALLGVVTDWRTSYLLQRL